MPLTNKQYDLIFREYEEKQNHLRHRQLQKTTEIYEKIPEYEEVEHTISSVSVAQAKNLRVILDSSLFSCNRNRIQQKICQSQP